MSMMLQVSKTQLRVLKARTCREIWGMLLKKTLKSESLRTPFRAPSQADSYVKKVLKIDRYLQKEHVQHLTSCESQGYNSTCIACNICVVEEQLI